MSLARWLDLLYPPACAVCGEPLQEGRYLCAPCRDDLPRIEQPFCIQCGEPFEGELPEDVLCTGCRGRDFSFEFARASHRARDEALELVHAFKYGRQVHLHRELAALATQAWEDPRIAAQSDPPWLLGPVPLHWRRRRWRWFNQSFELARTIGRLQDLPIDILTRTTLERVDSGKAVVRGPDGIREIGPFDSVVVAVGTRSSDELARPLRTRGLEVRVVGDAKRPNQVMGAVDSAWHVTRAL